MQPGGTGAIERDPADQHDARLGARAGDDGGAVEAAESPGSGSGRAVGDQAVSRWTWRIIDGKLYLVYDPTYVEDLDGPAREEILANAEAHWPETKAKIEQQGFN